MNFLDYGEFCTNEGIRRKNFGGQNKFRRFWDEISYGFAIFCDFLRGFSVPNRPPRPPYIRIFTRIFQPKIRLFSLEKQYSYI